MYKVILVPGSTHSEVISKAVKKAGLQIVEASGRKIGQLVNKNGSKEQTDESPVYKITYHSCSLPYFGESSRGLKKRISEHKKDLMYHNINNALVKHTQSC